ncbi:PREDICTED: uncharacterized protein LOC108378792 [Rhagoletis zephyria]|uniref:uncharacterized protein LOC108372109 n=1 Tax=Rhagoletis zephyria TaxID=28612 RepID=UPI0008115DC6|nr:PREDICTED: uncharacterized protein LOC108372109 [Rhagoletis zephyria]XP_017490585.1 PREDICTED: uncharacterized protein LOC108378792 [Rhagoletis zephyria]
MRRVKVAVEYSNEKESKVYFVFAAKMFLNLIILTTLLSAGVHAATTAHIAAHSELPNVQHIIYLPTNGNQVTTWPNSGHSVSPLYQQQIGGVVDSHKYQQAIQGHTGVVNAVNLQQQQPHSSPAAMSLNPLHTGNKEHFPGNFILYEDQVTILPQLDSRDSHEEYEVWPPVGIYPPPSPPPLAIKPTSYPAYYPLPYPVTKPTLRPSTTRPTTLRPTATRPTTTRPTTARPRPPQYPPFYPKPPYNPQYPLEGLPLYPHYPLPPLLTTQRPTTTTTTTPTTPRPSGADVQVLENYQIISDRGITKYKLRLSNGLTDYKKVTKKHIGQRTIYVQSGYYSVPVDPQRNKYNLIHYIADERGYRIIGVQACSNENPCRVLKE